MEVRLAYHAAPEVATVRVSERGVSVQPQHLYVKNGGEVAWKISVTPGMPPLQATFYFRGRSPFRWSTRDVSVTESQNAIQLTEKPSATGDYKYGVRVSERRSGNIIGDDDPYIHVEDA
jgi:hypothetical protein